MNSAPSARQARLRDAGQAANPLPGVSWRLAWLAALMLAIVPMPAKALETLNFTAPGASTELVETLRASSLLLATQQAGRVAPIDVMAAARAEYGRLIGLLYEQGHYAPTIHILVDGREAADISPLSNPRSIDTVSVEIALGPQFVFGRAVIAPLAPGTALPPAFASGEPARSTAVRAAMGAALDGWRAQGHALAAPAEQEIIANHNDNQLNVRLGIAPGPQLRFGTVRPQGNARTRSERIVAIAGLEPGALHDPQAIADAQERLRATGTFTSVVLRNAPRANPDGTLDVEVQVDEALPRRLGFGVEIDSQSGGRLSGFWMHRNLFGAADRLRLEAAVDGIAAQVGGLGFTLDARYVRPSTLRRDTDLELGLRAVRLNERDYGADVLEAEALLVRRFSPALTASLGANLRYERAEYGPGRGLSASFGTFGIPLSVTHDTRDSPLDATQGHYLDIDAMPYLGVAGTDSGLRLRFDARGYRALGGDGRVVLAGRAQLGAVVGADLAATPRDFLFYSGGGGSVRGLPYQSLGVTSGGISTGGRGLATLSGEARVRVNASVSMAVFADAGRVSAEAFSGASDWHAGGGFGIRYLTPIGPLRLDLAAPLRRNAAATGGRFQIYLGIGQAF